MTKFLSENGLLYYNQKITQKFNGKVDKVPGKGLSTNDLTDELLEKLNNAGDSSFSGNYADLTNKPKINNVELSAGNNTLETLGIQAKGDYATKAELAQKADTSAIPTNNNQLTNGAGYQTSSQVQSAINKAISGITGIDFQVVEELPGTGKKGVIYLVSNKGSGQNIYDEFIWVETKFEQIGTTAVDLSGYWSKTELTEIQNAEIDSIVGA